MFKGVFGRKQPCHNKNAGILSAYGSCREIGHELGMTKQMKPALRAFASFKCLLLAGLVLGNISGAPLAQAQQSGPQMSVPGQENAPEAAVLSKADQAWLARIEQTLNAVTTFKARMQQLDAEGKRTTGTVWMQRPGQMRLAYDAPTPLLLVANDGKVVFRDNELDQTTVIPMDRTPLGLLLRQNVRLSGDVTVTGFSHENGLLEVSLVRTAAPGDGSLTLVFYQTPLALRSWSVVDAQGRETRVTLFDVHDGVSIPAGTFTLPAQPE
ncbi:outer membrane lipoprotein carrier protein LolA [Acetobacter orientalis]|nr:outer membrane lipoprotein carrier protein LolA [Acetobacter orientalis]MCP1221061.1 outer membrane lipoprotein carrier protein LolA [Acetobacter orientalis]